MADVTLTYKGDTIAELSESGSKTIETAGKYCEADILLEYVKSGGGLPAGMTKVGSGSFTFASRTVLNTPITHGLDFTPKYVLCWTSSPVSTGEMLYGALTRYLVDIIGPTKSTRDMLVQSSSSSGLEDADYITNDADLFITPTTFNIGHGARYYAAGATYYWFAFA